MAFDMHSTAGDSVAPGRDFDRWALRAPVSRTVSPNTCLNGRLGGALYYLESGMLLVEFIVLQDQGAESFGMVLYQGDVIPSAMLESQTSVVVRSLTRAHLRLISDGELPWSQTSVAMLVQRGYSLWERLGRHATVIARMPAEVGFAHLLIEIASHIGHRNGNRCSIDMPMSRAQVAACTGLNPETLSRVITKCKANRLIETHGRRHVHILDWKALSALAEARTADPLTRSVTRTDGGGSDLPFQV